MITGVDIVTVTWPVWLLVVVLLAVFFVGLFGGNFSSRVEAEKKLEEARSRAEAALQQARQDSERVAARLAQVEKAASERPLSASMPGTTLLRLWLDANETPHLDLDNQQVEIAPIAEWHRKRLLTLLNVMRPWIEGRPAAIEPMPAPPAPVAQAPKPASKSIFSALPRPSLLPGKKEEPVAPTPSMVDQINDILQARLVTTPLANLGIRLQESPEGGVIVVVGTKKFAGVGEVTDPEVKAAIQAAISAWEKKYTPGG